MFSNHRSAALAILAGTGLVLSATLAYAQQGAFCDDHKVAPSDGARFSVACKGPGVPGASPFVGAAIFTVDPESGNSSLDFDITNHGECPTTGPERLECALLVNGQTQIGPLPEGDFDMPLNFTVHAAAIACGCGL